MVRRARREHRFYVDERLHEGQRLDLSATQSRQITGVLRLGRDDLVTLFDDSGNDFEARIVLSGKSGVQVEIESQEPGRPNPVPAIELGMALIKGDRFELVIQKATELGVARIQPLTTARTVVSLSTDRAEQRVERWRRIVIEAAEQSGRSSLPVIREPKSLDDALRESEDVPTILLWEGEQRFPLAKVLPRDAGRIRLLVGPEGGFNDDEVRRAIDVGATPATLGPLILRAETAAIAGIAAVYALSAVSDRDRAS